MKITREQRRTLRGLGHKIKPVVTVADKGLSENVMLELETALDHHELIKIRLRLEDRQGKSALIDEVCQRTGAEQVQTIGHIALIYRRNADQAKIKI